MKLANYICSASLSKALWNTIEAAGLSLEQKTLPLGNISGDPVRPTHSEGIIRYKNAGLGLGVYDLVDAQGAVEALRAVLVLQFSWNKQDPALAACVERMLLGTGAMLQGPPWGSCDAIYRAPCPLGEAQKREIIAALTACGFTFFVDAQARNLHPDYFGSVHRSGESAQFFCGPTVEPHKVLQTTYVAFEVKRSWRNLLVPKTEVMREFNIILSRLDMDRVYNNARFHL